MIGKKGFFVALACMMGMTASAQLKGDGYYRIQNVQTGRYMTLTDRHSRGANMHTTTVDAGALETRKLWSDLESDPGSIFYVKSMGNSQYNIITQGANLYDMTQYYVKLTTKNGGQSYKAWQEKSGTQVYMSDEDNLTQGADNGYVKTEGSTTRDWKVVAVDNGNNYLGIKPTVQSKGKYYAMFYAGYPVKLVSAGMKAYYVTRVDEAKGIAVYKEITGVIPASTPVLMECSSADVKNNKVEPVVDATKTPADNKLTGVYFCTGNRLANHYNSIKFEPTTMRVLGVNAKGELVVNNATDQLTNVRAIKSSSQYGDEYWNILAIPHNTAYVTVSASAPAELKLLSNLDPTGIENVVAADGQKASDVYTLAGVKVRSNATTLEGLPKGVYIYNNKKVVVE